MLKGEVKCTTMRRRGPSYPSYPSWLGPHGPLWGVFQWDGAVISTGAPALCLFSDSSTLLVAPTVQIFNPWNWPELTRVVNVVRNWLRSTPTPPLPPSLPVLPPSSYAQLFLWCFSAAIQMGWWMIDSRRAGDDLTVEIPPSCNAWIERAVMATLEQWAASPHDLSV